MASTLRALASGLLAWRLIQALLFALVQAAPGGPAAALDLAWHSVLPVATLALQQTAYFATVVYAKARIELGQGYVRATRARGIAERRILWGHVARNVSPQLATAVLNRLGMLFTGAVLVETLFAWPGLVSPLLDRLLQRLMDLSQIVPRFFLALLASAWLGPDWLALATILALTGWAALARQIRAEARALSRAAFVEAALLLGAPPWSVALRHLVPNVLALPQLLLIFASAPLIFASALLIEAGLSFLGAGDPNRLSWGSLIQSGQTYAMRGWWLALFPGLVLALTCIGLTLLTLGTPDMAITQVGND